MAIWRVRGHIAGAGHLVPSKHSTACCCVAQVSGSAGVRVTRYLLSLWRAGSRSDLAGELVSDPYPSFAHPPHTPVHHPPIPAQDPSKRPAATPSAAADDAPAAASPIRPAPGVAILQYSTSAAAALAIAQKNHFVRHPPRHYPRHDPRHYPRHDPRHYPRHDPRHDPPT